MARVNFSDMLGQKSDKARISGRTRTPPYKGVRLSEAPRGEGSEGLENERKATRVFCLRFGRKPAGMAARGIFGHWRELST